MVFEDRPDLPVKLSSSRSAAGTEPARRLPAARRIDSPRAEKPMAGDATCTEGRRILRSIDSDRELRGESILPAPLATLGRLTTPSGNGNFFTSMRQGCRVRPRSVPQPIILRIERMM